MPSVRFVHNLLSLYGVQFATLLLPLATLPFLARILGPEAWGQLAAVQALALTLSLVVEYGFGLSATRTVAASPQDFALHASTVADVMSAKAVLSIVALLGVFVIFAFVPAFREQPLFLTWGALYAVAQGMTPLWYFQAVERLELASIVDVLTKLVATALIFLLVRRAEDAPLVLALQASCIAFGQWINTTRMYRTVPFVPLTFESAIRGIRNGWTMFLFRGAVSSYTIATTALLRGFVPSADVAVYANADRLITALKSFVQPAVQVMFPRLSLVVKQNMRDARVMVSRSLFILVVLAFIVMIVVIILAPVIITIIFGNGYKNSISLLRILSLSIPCVAASSVLGVQWMIPLKMDAAFTTIVISAGVINIILALILIPVLGTSGMAWSIVLVELYISLSMFIYLISRGQSPLGRL